jgi:hypothetical protein
MSQRSRSILFMSAREMLMRLGWTAASLSGLIISCRDLGFGMASCTHASPKSAILIIAPPAAVS